jgi:hypothetical protein
MHKATLASIEDEKKTGSKTGKDKEGEYTVLNAFFGS